MVSLAKEERQKVGTIELSFSYDIQAGESGGDVDVTLGSGNCSIESVDIVNEKEFWVGGDKPKAVSYTHLDVYKRQEQGIELIHEEGIEKFSLRKVAKKVGVSATACYNHFENIDELLLGMYSYVTDRFATALQQAVEENSCQYATISMGVAYVEFFAKYPHYFNFLFDSE